MLEKANESAQTAEQVARELAVYDLLTLAQSDAPERHETPEASADEIRAAIVQISDDLHTGVKL